MKRTQTNLCYFDNSPSVRSNMPYIKSSLFDFLHALASKNKEDVDLYHTVEAYTFNNQVNPLTGGCALDPEKVLEMISRPGDEDREDLPDDAPYTETNELFLCQGLTNIADLCEHINMRLTRQTGGLVPAQSSANPAPNIIIVTDLLHTVKNNLDAPWDTLHRNKFFNQCKKIVIFLGPSSKASAAQELAGGAENVITLNDNIADHLSQVFFDSVMLSSDSTHLEARNQTPKDIANDIRDKLSEGQQSAAEINEADQLMAEVKRMLYPNLA